MIKPKLISKTWSGEYANGSDYTLTCTYTHSKEAADKQHLISFEYRLIEYSEFEKTKFGMKKTFAQSTVTEGRWNKPDNYNELIEYFQEKYEYDIHSYIEKPDLEGENLIESDFKRWTSTNPLSVLPSEFLSHLHTYHDVEVTEGKIRGQHSENVE